MANLEAEFKVYQIIWPILVAILSFAVGVIGALLKVLWSNHNQKETEQDEAIKEIRKDMQRLPYDFVSRDDFARWTTGFEMKMDSMFKELKELRADILKMLMGKGEPNE